MNDRRRPRPPARPKPAGPLTGPIVLDDATRNALILFNARLDAQEARERELRRVDKAAKAKDEAAARVRNLEGDTKATAEQKAEAQAAYMAALDAWNKAKAGEPAGSDEAPGDDATPDADADADSAEEAAASDTSEYAAGGDDATSEAPAADEAAAVDDVPASDDEPAGAAEG